MHLTLHASLKRLMLLGLIAATAASCSGEPKPPESSSPPQAVPQSGDIALRPIQESLQFDKPVGIERRPDRPERLYVIEQPGRIKSVNIEQPGQAPSLVLDLTDRAHDEGSEQGLLGLAFHPERPSEAYVNYTTATHTVIARYEADPSDPELLDPDSEQVLLTFEQPYANHNGGQLAFGPDGYLYIGTGDGGSGGDPHNYSQSLQSLLGKILRIDVDSAEGSKPYAIPSDNPFIGEGAPEIYAYGLRNPWRFSFDPVTGQLWAADVGQQRYEEINIVSRGANYGWRIMEGTACYDPAEGCEASGLEQPVHSYGRELGVSITGGFVYRGSEIPGLAGSYVYADYGTGTIWALAEREGQYRNTTVLESGLHITSFGMDAAGELYISTLDGAVMRLVLNPNHT